MTIRKFEPCLPRGYVEGPQTWATAATTIPSASPSGSPAGASSKKGVVYGETDDFCYNVVENPAHIHDLNATILHCLGIDHRRLSFKFQGPDMRLTGVEEHSPIKGILV